MPLGEASVAARTLEGAELPYAENIINDETDVSAGGRQAKPAYNVQLKLLQYRSVG